MKGSKLEFNFWYSHL